MLVRHAADTDLPALLLVYRQLNPLAVAPTHPEGGWAAIRAHAGVTVCVAEEKALVAATSTLIVPEPPYDVIVVLALLSRWRGHRVDHPEGAQAWR